VCTQDAYHLENWLRGKTKLLTDKAPFSGEELHKLMPHGHVLIALFKDAIMEVYCDVFPV